MSSYKTQFSFQNHSQIMVFPVEDNVLATIESIGPSLARLYFVQNEAEIKIPLKIQVYDKTNNVRVDPLRNREDFVLCWTDDYSIYKNKEILLQLSNKRVWSVHGIPSIPVKFLDT